MKTGKCNSGRFDGLGLCRAHEMAGLRIDGGFCILVIAKRALGLVAKITVFQIDESFGSDKIGSNRAPIFFIVGRVGDIGPLGNSVFG